MIPKCFLKATRKTVYLHKHGSFDISTAPIIILSIYISI